MHFTGGRNVVVELIDLADGPVLRERSCDGEAVHTPFTPHEAMKVFPSAIREVVLEEHAAQVRFDDRSRSRWSRLGHPPTPRRCGTASRRAGRPPTLLR